MLVFLAARASKKPTAAAASLLIPPVATPSLVMTPFTAVNQIEALLLSQIEAERTASTCRQ